ncbi:MAG: hypothetical protein EHM28_02990 [Spirochaetaceae bacterium]|nr:MAG: hypothetical protein EHM28_02990 [Spirochaetaceae bacterium]
MKRIPLFVLFLVFGLVCHATTIEEVVEVCAVCGQMSTQTVVRSTNQMGSPDLDLRPPEMARSTIRYWVQKCPHCGYCHSDISELAKNAKETIADPAYKKIPEQKQMPELAVRFLCMAMVHEKAGNMQGTISATIFAAWACDDEAAEESANKAAMFCREMAALRISEYKKSGESYMADPGGDEILLSDLYRRCLRFDLAIEAAKAGLESKPEELIKNILLFEKALAEKKDSSVYTVAQVPGAQDQTPVNP